MPDPLRIPVYDPAFAWWLDDSNYNAGDYTKWVLSHPEKSRYRKEIDEGAEILFKRFDSPIEIKESDDPYVLPIDGMASTDDWDRDNERILVTAFDKYLDEFLENAIMLVNHDWYGLPIGEIVETEIRSNGLWVKGDILLKIPMGSAVAELVKRRILKTFSIGFRVMDSEQDEETDRRIITEIKLYEVSIVNIPANRFARFGLSKTAIDGVDKDMRMSDRKRLVIKSYQSLNDKWADIFENKIAEDGDQIGGTFMPETNSQIEKKVMTFLQENVTDVLDDVKGSVKTLTTSRDELNTTVKAMQDKLDDMKNGLIGQSDLDTAISKISTDIEKLSGQIQTAKLVGEVSADRIHYKDWRTMTDFMVFDDVGKLLTGMPLKTYKYFRAPVDYKSSDEGHLLLLARNLWDSALITDAYFRGSNRSGYSNMTQLDSFKNLTAIMDRLDSEFSEALKALYSTGSGVGDEWVETLSSAQLEELYRLEPNLDSHIPKWDMPSNPANWPFLAGAAQCYIASEPATNNPDELKKSQFATNRIVFTAKDFAVAIPVSRNFIEDSIIAVVPEIRQELVWALSEGFEDCLINGDTTATHMDSDVTASDDHRKAFKGLRRHAKDDSAEFDTQSTTTGVGDATAAFHALDVVYTAQFGGVMSVKPDENMYYTGAKGYFGMLKMTGVTDQSAFGRPGTYAVGQLPVFLGREVYVSGVVRENLAPTGVYTGSTATHTHVGHFNKRKGFKIGSRRGITIDYEFNARSQQWTFVGTTRRDLQKMQPSTRKPSQNGYNIE